MIKQRKTFLDILRILAALGVVFYHVITSSMTLDPAVSEQMSRFVLALAKSLLWHVPTFLMITGFLWLSDEKECTYTKVLPGIRRFVLVLFTVGLLFAMIERFYRYGYFSLELFGWSIADVLIGNLWEHMWYVYTIIGLYLVLPVLKPFFRHSSVQSISVLCGLLFLFTILLQNLKNNTGYVFPVSVPMTNPSYPVFFVCMGGLLAKLTLPRKTPWIAGAAFILSAVTCFLVVYFLPSWGHWINLFVSVCAISLFAAVKVLAEQTPDIPWLRGVSQCTFGVYLIHPLFINVLMKGLHWYPLRRFPVIAVLGTFVLITLASFGITFLLRKIRWVRNYIL